MINFHVKTCVKHFHIISKIKTEKLKLEYSNRMEKISKSLKKI